MKARFAACLLLISLTLALPAAAQEATPEALPPELEAQLDNLVNAAETIRELDTLSPVERRFPTRADTIAYLTQLYDADMSPDQLALLEAFYHALGILPTGESLRDTYLALLGAQVGGFYDPSNQTMNVLPLLGDDVTSGLSISERIIFIHEYVHALQDQHFGLDSLLTGDDFAPDAALARLSLVEGDASAAMNLYAQQVMLADPGLALSLLTEGALSGTLTLPPGTPAGLARELLFPYDTGMQFIVQVYADGGWDAINAAYANPPATSEQIIHPDKYLAGEGALEVAPVDLSARLTGDWQPVWTGTLGEYYLRELLRQYIGAGEINRAADGWGGDTFTLLQDAATGDLAWALNLAWDTPAEAEEFAALIEPALQQAAGSDRALLLEDGVLISAPAASLNVAS